MFYNDTCAAAFRTGHNQHRWIRPFLRAAAPLSVARARPSVRLVRLKQHGRRSCYTLGCLFRTTPGATARGRGQTDNRRSVGRSANNYSRGQY